MKRALYVSMFFFLGQPQRRHRSTLEEETCVALASLTSSEDGPSGEGVACINLSDIIERRSAVVSSTWLRIKSMFPSLTSLESGC